MADSRSSGLSIRTCPAQLMILLVCVSSGLSEAASAELGRWKEETQTIWDGKQEATRAIRVWDTRPDLDLDFEWLPDGTSQGLQNFPNGPITGSGMLTWYKTASTGERVTFSVFSGALRKGKADGQGILVDRSGMSYTGSWKAGEMSGRGDLKFSNGDEYVGEFVNGRMSGSGVYSERGLVIFDGRFKNGLRDGRGTLIEHGKSYETEWSGGKETKREPNIGTSSPGLVANMTIGVDRRSNTAFLWDQVDLPSYAYEQTITPKDIKIALSESDVLNVWKNDTELKSGFAYETSGGIADPSQFAPVFLSIKIDNKSKDALEIVDAYLEVSKSLPDREPYLQIESASIETDAGNYDPTFNFTNYGWGEVKQAVVRFTIGPESARSPETVVSIGDFDASASLTESVDRALRELGVKTALLKEQYSYPCALARAALRACLRKIADSGLLGRNPQFFFPMGRLLITQIAGSIEYQWTDLDQQPHSRQSRFAVDIPILQFEGPYGEGGDASGTERHFSAIGLKIDGTDYRVPLAMSGRVSSESAISFSFSVEAPESSRHRFRAVVDLKDGERIVSPDVDLLYFRPRFPKPSDDVNGEPSDDVNGEPSDDVNGDGSNGSDIDVDQ